MKHSIPYSRWILGTSGVLLLSGCVLSGEPSGQENSREDILIGKNSASETSPGIRVEAGNSASPSADDGDAGLLRTRFVEIAQSVSPGVVLIRSVHHVRASWLDPGSGAHGGGVRGWLRRLLGFGEEPAVRQEGIGSGFLIHRAGYALTNAHVVDRAERISVVFSDGRNYKGRVLAEDRGADLALVKIDDPRPFPFLVLGDSDRLETGEWALAVGSPFGLPQTFTVGVISATRAAKRESRSPADFIQTDASINYGNSGGPLLNIEGEVVGINTAILPASHGIGLAIPINAAREFSGDRILLDLERRAWLGIRVASSFPEPGRREGVRVVGVGAGSPAARAGIRVGDRISEVDGRAVREIPGLRALIAEGEVGQDRILTLGAQGSTRRVSVALTERPQYIFP